MVRFTTKVTKRTTMPTVERRRLESLELISRQGSRTSLHRSYLRTCTCTCFGFFFCQSSARLKRSNSLLGGFGSFFSLLLGCLIALAGFGHVDRRAVRNEVDETGALQVGVSLVAEHVGVEAELRMVSVPSTGVTWWGRT